MVQQVKPNRFITKEITASEIPYELPDSWNWVRLNEICSLITDINHKMPRSVSEGVKFISAKDLVENGKINLENKVKRISEDDYFELGKRVIPQRGDIIYSRIGTIGKSRVVKTDERFMVSYSLCVIRPKGVNTNYLNYYLDSGVVLKQAKEEARSIGVPDLGMQSIKNFLIALPPLPEQERIVSRIEELFSDLEAGVASLERVRVGLKRYKMSVLKAAFEGRLVPQDESIEPAAVLLERVLGKDYAKEIAPSESSKVPFIPTGWAYGKLEKLIYIAGRIGWRGLKADEYTQEGPLFLSVYNLNKGDHVDFSDTYHISQERYEESPEIMLQENDILLAKDGAGIGKIGIVKDLPGQATVNSSLLVIRASEIFIPEFLFYLLKGPQMQDIVRARITGSATPHLFQRDIKKFTLLIPPLDEQRRIVAEVERRLSVIGEVESAVDAGLVRAGRLRQSVLRSAFEGRL